MIIPNANILETNDVGKYAWRHLAQYTNIDFTTKLICILHQLGSKQKCNARKQAEQLKFCIIQAREYFDSSKSVSLATKPLLLYYCVMSLALVEILLKQDGNSRLSALRENHNCHGLTLILNSDPDPTADLNSSSSQLIAKPQIDSKNNPKGTFEVWRRSARKYPVGGYQTQWYASANSKTYMALLSPEDLPPKILSTGGISLRSCLINLPYMGDTLSRWGARLEMVRATVSRNLRYNGLYPVDTISVHPNYPDILDKFYSLCQVHPDLCGSISINELPSGSIINWEHTQNLPMKFPNSTCINSESIYFTCSEENMNEFGYLYIALHILGNFARYYPDLWMKHIELNSPLSNAADNLCDFAMERLPLLSLSELSRSYHIVK